MELLSDNLPLLTVGPDVKLRPLLEDDAPELFALTDRNRAYLGKYLPWVEETTEEAQSREFIRRCGIDWEAGTSAHFGIFMHGELVGHVSIMHIVPTHKAEIGYWLSEHVGRQGIMARSVRAVVEYAFEERGLVRLLIRCRKGNAPSAAVAKRLGFQFEGIERHGDQHGSQLYDLECYSLIAADRAD